MGNDWTTMCSECMHLIVCRMTDDMREFEKETYGNTRQPNDKPFVIEVKIKCPYYIKRVIVDG